MNETINKGLLKEESLSAKIYFLLLDKPKTQTEISRLIYSGKVQLSNIKKNLEDLEKEGYVGVIGRKVGVGNNYNKIYYQSKLKPIIDFIDSQVKYRKDTSKSKQKSLLTKADEKFIESFLYSNWFKRFYSQEYLNIDKECEGKVNKRVCSCPIRFFARLLEEIFVITESFNRFGINFSDSLDLDNFDKSLLKISKQVKKDQAMKIKRIVKSTKESLGNYYGTNKTLDFYFYEFGVLAFPPKVAEKLSSIGRIPLTIELHFIDALREEFYYK